MHSQIRNHQVRTGVAPIEFALSLPILLMVAIAIVWLGASMISQSEVTIEARDGAWQQRFEDASGRPLVFVTDTGDLVSETSTATVEVSPMLDGVSSPESKHDVLAGAWDHRSMMNDDGPHWRLYVLAAANAKTAGLQNAYVDASNQLAQLQGLSDQILSQALADAAAKFTGIDEFQSAANAAENTASSRAESERAKAEAAVARLREQLRETDQQIRVAKQEVRQAEDDAEKEALELRVDFLELKRKRLKIEIDANRRIARSI